MTNDDEKVVGKAPDRPKLSIGRPRKIATTSAMRRIGYPNVAGNALGSGGNFYSPELSTDFLELPQSLDEQRNYYRFFYKTDPFVGQAIDLHTELPLSKIRLGNPDTKDRELGNQALEFCQRWSKKIGLLHIKLKSGHYFQM